ncbi:BRCT domain, partial [Dillenia turbinata]
MADSSSSNSFCRFLNPWVLHLQKLGLELKCPLCSCIPKSTQFGSECPLCHSHYQASDRRLAGHTVSMVSIFRCLEASFGANYFQSVSSGSRQSIFELVANKRIHIPLTDSSGKEVGIDFDKPGSQKESKVENFRVCSKERANLDGKANLNGGLKQSQLQAKEREKLEEVQLMTASPPSFGDAKGFDFNSTDQGSERHTLKRSIQTSDDWIGLEMDGSCKTGDEVLCDRELKRQKKLNYESMEHKENHDETKTSVPHSENQERFDLELENAGSQSGEQQSVVHGHSDANGSICAFCHSSRLSEASGPMLHYSNGIPVVGDEANGAPQVYYDGEIVKNLEGELARSAKLKCSSCGIKGAALGCCVETCRKNFHVPCAVAIPDCRWDCKDFLLLCPIHSSRAFPREKPKAKHRKKNKRTSSHMASEHPKILSEIPGGAKDRVLCGSALSGEEKVLLVKFARMIGATVTRFWKPNATHVIASTDEKGAYSRTLKVLMAILNGRWILKIDWIKACLEAMQLLQEEPYEVCLDVHGSQNGPRNGRLRALANEPNLFNGLNFYFSGDFVPAYLADLQILVSTGGGIVLKGEEILAAESSDTQTPSTTLVYNLDAPEGSAVGEEVSLVLQRLEKAEELAAVIGGQVICHTWILESIAACGLQPLTPCYGSSKER